jgi:hypothetical protein
MNKLAAFLIMLVIVLLAGCATHVKSDVAPDLVENGVVLLPVTDRALFTATGVRFFVVSSTGKSHLLTANRLGSTIPKNDGMGTIYLSAFSLPAEEYEFVSWSFIQTQGGVASKPEKKISFKLNKGDVLYLGNFNAIRVLGSGQFRDNFDHDMREYIASYRWMEGLHVKREQIKTAWWSLSSGYEPKVIEAMKSR